MRVRTPRTRLPGALAATALLVALGVVANTGVAQATPSTGFAEPFAGAPQYEHLAPTELDNQNQLHQPIGQQAADTLAIALGLNKAETFTHRQFVEFVSGGGVGGNRHDAALVDQSVRILTNTVGRPLFSKIKGHITATVLASYGLMVDKVGRLESDANKTAPTRRVNKVLVPGGYMSTWCNANGAQASLEMLYRSAYTVDAVFGHLSQQQSGKAQLVPNNKAGVHTEVGMSMAPSIWIVNFALIYTLNPALAADMPARWAPIPPIVSEAILASRTGRVPYNKYASYLQ
jgi:hypothetical protein